jgi:hypothetical protein
LDVRRQSRRKKLSNQLFQLSEFCGQTVSDLEEVILRFVTISLKEILLTTPFTNKDRPVNNVPYHVHRARSLFLAFVDWVCGAVIQKDCSNMLFMHPLLSDDIYAASAARAMPALLLQMILFLYFCQT